MVYIVQLLLAPLSLVAGGCIGEYIPPGYKLVSTSSNKAYKLVTEIIADAHHAQYLCSLDNASLAMPKGIEELKDIMTLNRK